MHGTSSPMTRKLSAQSPHASMLKRSVNKAVGITTGLGWTTPGYYSLKYAVFVTKNGKKFRAVASKRAARR
jgi:hypothetical protein